MKRSRIRYAAVVSAFLLFLSACSTVPVTGRKQFNIMSDVEMAKMATAQYEMMKAHMPISNNRQMNRVLQDVGERISEKVYLDMPMADWEFTVFDIPEINAFAMPGGKVGIYSGLFQIVKDEDELASVIAHEIAHVTARHGHEQASQQGVMDGMGNIVGVTTGGLGSLVYGSTTQGNVPAWDREREIEADRIGLIYMARAGYDPRAAIRVMERMVQLDGGATTVPWYSTHPSSQDRLSALHGELDRAMEEYKKATAGRQELPEIVF